MKKRILFIVFVSFTSIFLGQLHEVGISLGGTNYVGDIGRNYYFYPNKPAGALFYKYNWNPRIALRGTYSYLPISADDANADTGFRKDRDLSFNNTINELAIGIEYNFYEYDLSSNDKTWTPYLLLELAAFNYDSSTENSANNGYDDINKTSYAIPFGIGYKSKLFGALAFAIEAKFRYTFKDDLDSALYESSGNLPTGLSSNDIENLKGIGNDWYMFTGVSLIYTFGRPSCYTTGL